MGNPYSRAYSCETGESSDFSVVSNICNLIEVRDVKLDVVLTYLGLLTYLLTYLLGNLKFWQILLTYYFLD